MSITIQLAPEVEKLVQHEAVRQGMKLDHFIANLVERQYRPPKNGKKLSGEEAILLQKISTGFPKEFWDKYKALVKKRQAEALTEDEYQLLNEMGDRLELANAERIRNLS
ncbi:MAG: hypothetical protein AAB316_16770, partial [Bacteroidota bacterium]